MGQPQTFRAICPDAKALHVFQIVSDGGQTMGWCTKCRKSFAMAELSDGKTEADDKPKPWKKKKKYPPLARKRERGRG